MNRGWYYKARAFAADRCGNVAVEFALVAPVFILLIVGLLDYGIAARERSALDAATRAGLQVLLADSDETAAAEATAALIAPDAEVSADVACICVDGAVVDCASGTCAAGAPRRFVTVTATLSHTLMFPWPGTADPMSLESTATARAR